MIVQIYEIRSPDEAGERVALGVDHIGVLVGSGEFPRETGIQRTDRDKVRAFVVATQKS